ncbi:unnamed protein product [Chrysoparadoxa australica]
MSGAEAVPPQHPQMLGQPSSDAAEPVTTVGALTNGTTEEQDRGNGADSDSGTSSDDDEDAICGAPPAAKPVVKQPDPVVKAPEPAHVVLPKAAVVTPLPLPAPAAPAQAPASSAPELSLKPEAPPAEPDQAAAAAAAATAAEQSTGSTSSESDEDLEDEICGLSAPAVAKEAEEEEDKGATTKEESDPAAVAVQEEPKKGPVAPSAADAVAPEPVAEAEPTAMDVVKEEPAKDTGVVLRIREEDIPVEPPMGVTLPSIPMPTPTVPVALVPEPVQAQAAAPQAQAAPAAPAALPPPAPTHASPSATAAAMWGTMKVEADGVHRCAGRWGVSKNAAVTSPFEFTYVPPAGAGAGASVDFPKSGQYDAFFIIQGRAGQEKVLEQDLRLSFVVNSAGSWNVAGSGFNRFGQFRVTGVLEQDGNIQVFREYSLGKKGGSKRSSARAAGGGGYSGGGGTRKRPANGSLGREVATEAPSRRRSQGVARLSEPMRKCSRTLNDLVKLKSKSVWFMAPVDHVALKLPDYTRVVKHPMDLGTVRKNLDAGRYHDPEEFSADVRLVFTNAMLYNTDRASVVHQCAKELLGVFEKKFSQIVDPMDNDDSDASFSDGSYSPSPVATMKRKKSASGFNSGAAGAAGRRRSAASGGGGGSRARGRAGPRPQAAAQARAEPPPMEGSVPLGQLAEMQRKMEEMQAFIMSLQQQHSVQPEPAEEPLPPPRAAGGGRGRGRASSAAGGRGRQGNGGAAAAAPPDFEEDPLTFEEKRLLSQNINKLSQYPDKLSRVVQIISERTPLGERPADDEEIEIDIDSMDNGTLRELQDYVAGCLSKPKKRGGGRGLDVSSSDSEGEYY